MAIPFGFGIGDFLAVGKLIGRIIVELREVRPIPIIPPYYRPYLISHNGEAAPDYQSLLLELEALGRALHQLENLQPTKHELLQLNAIRATALTCQRPLQDFSIVRILRPRTFQKLRHPLFTNHVIAYLNDGVLN
jgi:hypothetical protein